MVSATRFYQRAALLPFIVPLACAGLALALAKASISLPVGNALVGDMLGFVALAGFVSAIPYAVFLLYVIVKLKPSTEADYRFLSWAGPGWVTFIAVVLAGIIVMLHGSISGAMATAGFISVLGCLVGYGYAAVINGALMCARRRGMVE